MIEILVKQTQQGWERIPGEEHKGGREEGRSRHPGIPGASNMDGGERQGNRPLKEVSAVFGEALDDPVRGLALIQ